MTNIEPKILKEILSVHEALWNALYDFDADFHSLEYQGKTYNIHIPAQRGYASVLLPNSNGTNFLWITQNLNKSSYGSSLIQKHRSENKDTRLTWIVDTRHGQFKYVSHIRTTKDDEGNLVYGVLETYNAYGTECLWSTEEFEISRKSKF
jgi:hypothetical protein